MDTDFTTEDIIVTEQTLDNVLKIQALYTAYVESENEREANEEARIKAENERGDAESKRQGDINTMKQDISDLQDEMETKVDAEFGMGLSTNDFTDSDAMKLSDIEDGAQKNVQSDWNTSDTKSDSYIKNKPVIDQSYKSESQNAQSGTAVAQAIAQLVGSAPDTLNTLEELADALKDNADIVDVLNEAIAGKADKINGYGLVSVGSVNAGDANKRWYVLSLRKSDNIGSGWTGEVYSKSAIDYNLNLKVDKIDGKGLSTNDFTNAEKEKLSDMNVRDIGRIDDLTELDEIFDDGIYYFNYGTDSCIMVVSSYIGYAHSPIVQTICPLNIQRLYSNEYEDSDYELYWSDWEKIFVNQVYNRLSEEAQSGKAVAQAINVLKSELKPTPLTSITGTLSPNQPYHLSEPPSSIVFPSVDVFDGDTIYITFMTGNTPPTISIDMKNTTDIDIEIEADTGYEIYGKYVANINKWIVGYSSYKVPGGDEA